MTIWGIANIGLDSSVSRALVRQTRGLGFKPRFSHTFFAHLKLIYNCAQSVSILSLSLISDEQRLTCDPSIARCDVHKTPQDAVIYILRVSNHLRETDLLPKSTPGDDDTKWQFPLYIFSFAWSPAKAQCFLADPSQLCI